MMKKEKLDLVTLCITNENGISVSGFKGNGNEILIWVVGKWGSFPIDWIAVDESRKNIIRRFESND